MIKTCEEYVLQRISLLEEERDNLEADYEAITRHCVMLEKAIKALNPTISASTLNAGKKYMTFTGFYEDEDGFEVFRRYAKDTTKEPEE